MFMRDGTVMEQGTHEDLMANENSEYASLVQMLSKDDNLHDDSLDGNNVFFML